MAYITHSDQQEIQIPVVPMADYILARLLSHPQDVRVSCRVFFFFFFFFFFFLHFSPPSPPAAALTSPLPITIVHPATRHSV